MVETIEGVVLLSTPYNDTSSIVNVLTARYGRLSFLVSNVRSSKSSVKRTHFQHLNRLELVVDLKQGQRIHRIKESRLICQYPSILSSPTKRMISLFVAEVLHRMIRNEEYEFEMYDFVVDSVQVLELSDERFANFHLLFLVGMIRILGFFPHIEQYQEGAYFDIQQGEFVRSATPASLSPLESSLVYSVMANSYAGMSEIKLSREQRNCILNRLLEYIRKHINPTLQFNSVDILREL